MNVLIIIALCLLIAIEASSLWINLCVNRANALVAEDSKRQLVRTGELLFMKERELREAHKTIERLAADKFSKTAFIITASGMSALPEDYAERLAR